MLARPLVPAIRPGYSSGLAALTAAVLALLSASWVSQAWSPDALQWAKWLIVAPVIEELFFRGVIQHGLRTRAGMWSRPWPAIVLTALLFGLAHLAAASALHSALVVAPALVIGWAYERTRSLLLCIALHSAFNGIWLLSWSI